MNAAGEGRRWLDVPYSEKDEAKALGARWDARARRWYAPPTGTTGLQRWAARPDVPDLLPGEDRTFGHGLFIDLVPASCWFTNVRSCVDQGDWERLRRMITRRAGDRCEACRRGPDRDSGRWLEAHERWHYDQTTHTQTLRRLICLCTDCHHTTHYGLATVQHRDHEARAHLRQVTGMTEAAATDHISAAFALWKARSAYHWDLDLSILTDAGITLAPPPARDQREHIARDRLEQLYTGTGQTPATPPPAAVRLPSVPPPPLPAPDTARRGLRARLFGPR